MRWIWVGLVLVGIAMGLHGAASADEAAPSSDLGRAQLSRVLAVLQLKPDAAGQSCLDALREVHHTADQLKILQGQAKHPDLGLAQDVLETDYENGNEICGADASRVCGAANPGDRLAAACAALHGPH